MSSLGFGHKILSSKLDPKKKEKEKLFCNSFKMSQNDKQKNNSTGLRAHLQGFLIS